MIDCAHQASLQSASSFANQNIRDRGHFEIADSVIKPLTPRRLSSWTNMDYAHCADKEHHLAVGRTIRADRR
jgi:hypothetical protein